MIHISVKQGSPDWRLERFGIPTASNAGNIITAAKGERSKQQDGYIAELIAERYAKQYVLERCTDPTTAVENIEHILNRVKTESMAYGNAMESTSASAYSLITGNELTEAGFMLNDERTAGASLDRLVVGQNKGVEIKSPFSLGVHVGYMLTREIGIDKRPQLQWQMWISGLDEIDICSYYPGVPAVIKTVQRDEEYISKIAEYHSEFIVHLEERWNEWCNLQPKK